MKRLWFALLLLLTVHVCRAQTDDIPVMIADRPGMSWTADIMMPLKFEFETGFSFQRTGNGADRQDYILYNTSMLRFGINKNAEIRVQCDYAGLRTPDVNISGFNPLIFGTKLNLIEGSGIIPKTSLLMNVTLPWAGKKEFRPANLLPSFYLAMQNNITEKLNVCYNIGIDYNEESEATVEFFGLCLSYCITPKFSAFVENYNYFAASSAPVNSADLGCAWQLTDNIQLDLSGNLNLNDIRHYFMINIGGAWRILRHNKPVSGNN
jgi:hypothetical protein